MRRPHRLVETVLALIFLNFSWPAQADDTAQKALDTMDRAQPTAPTAADTLAPSPPSLALSATYANARYGYGVSYPPDILIPQGEADNGDGQVFLTRDGRAEMRVYASINVLSETLEAHFKSSLAEQGFRPTYQVLRKNWYVVSGLHGNAIFYRKTIQAKDVFYTVSFTYPPDLQAVFDALIPRIIREFQLFR